MKRISFFDIELNPQTAKIEDIGCIRDDGAVFHKKDIPGFFDFIKAVSYTHLDVYKRQTQNNNSRDSFKIIGLCEMTNTLKS